jgi:two-component system chemotaxis response regulator CheV
MSFQSARLDTGESVALLSLEPHGIPSADSPLPAVIPRVLFVDDADPARRVFEEVVAELGMQGWGCSGSAAGWAALEELASRAEARGLEVSTNLALILVDAEMPGQDGYALAKKIVEDVRFARVRVALHSSLYSQANRAMGEAVGVALYAPPFGKEALAKFIEEQAGHGR